MQQAAALGSDTSLLHTILNQSDLLIALIAESGLIVACNDTVFRFALRTPSEIVGKYVFDLRITFPVQTLEQWTELRQRVRAERQVVIETEIGQKGGTTYTARFVLSEEEHRGERYIMAVGRRMETSEPIRAKIEREARWQKALFEMATDEAAVRGDIVEAVWNISLATRLVFPAHHCRVWKIEGDVLNLIRHADDDSQVTSIPLHEHQWMGQCYESNRAVVCLEACRSESETAAARMLLKKNGVVTSLAAPILVSGNRWGLLTIGSATERKWQAEELWFANQVADQVSHLVLNEERRRAEAQLEASRERYRSFVEMSRELMARLEFDRPIPMSLPIEDQVAAFVDLGFVADCNTATAQFFGFKDAEQMKGGRVKSLSPGWAKHGFLQRLAKAGFQIFNAESEYRMRGQTRWVLESYQGVIENGELIRLWATSRDITDFRRAQETIRHSEERYRAFVSNSSEGILLIEYEEPIPVHQPFQTVFEGVWKTGRITECNQAYAKMRGFEPREKLIGRPIIEFRLDTEEARKTIGSFIRNGFRLTGAERPNLAPDGSVRWYRYSMTGVVEDECLARTWATVSDINEQKKLEEDLRSLSSRRSSILEQERARVAREIHDELGQQLTVLKFEAAAMESGKQQPVKGKLTGEIDAVIHTVRKIATDLRPAILDQYGLGAAVEWQATEFGRRTGIACETEVDKQLNVNGTLSITAFRILQEALTNVARHSQADHVKVRLRRRGDECQLTVEDNGVGLNIGEVRGKHTLGLIGMRERALEAGGRWTIDDGGNGGTVVTVTLPLTEPEAAA